MTSDSFCIAIQSFWRQKSMSKSFDYLICLDFEATCWEERDSQKAEIIGIIMLTIWYTKFSESVEIWCPKLID